MFHLFRQNNSGGRFDYDERVGISHLVWVETEEGTDLNERAEKIGLYFNSDWDCDCCGSRWSEYEAEYDRLTVEPDLYGNPISKKPWFAEGSREHKSMDDGQSEGFVHYLDGRIESHWGQSATPGGEA